MWGMRREELHQVGQFRLRNTQLRCWPICECAKVLRVLLPFGTGIRWGVLHAARGTEMNTLPERLIECACVLRELASQIVYPEHVKEQWLERAMACEEAAAILRGEMKALCE